MSKAHRRPRWVKNYYSRGRRFSLQAQGKVPLPADDIPYLEEIPIAEADEILLALQQKGAVSDNLLPKDPKVIHRVIHRVSD